MIDNMLYLSTMHTRVVALDAETGEELWVFDPRTYETGSAGASPGGYKHRGVAVHGDGDDMRIFINSRDRLYALVAKTGARITTFGDAGKVMLTEGFPNAVSRDEFDQTSPPVVFETWSSSAVAYRIAFSTGSIPQAPCRRSMSTRVRVGGCSTRCRNQTMSSERTRGKTSHGDSPAMPMSGA